MVGFSIEMDGKTNLALPAHPQHTETSEGCPVVPCTIQCPPRMFKVAVHIHGPIFNTVWVTSYLGIQGWGAVTCQSIRGIRGWGASATSVRVSADTQDTWGIRGWGAPATSIPSVRVSVDTQIRGYSERGDGGSRCTPSTAPSNLGIRGYSDRGDGGSRCAQSTDAPSNLGIHGYCSRCIPASHPQIPCVTWCPLLWFMGMHSITLDICGGHCTSNGRHAEGKSTTEICHVHLIASIVSGREE